jgi:cephalosporin hydroxylase
MIVELGCLYFNKKGFENSFGESHFVLTRVASLFDSYLLSLDIRGKASREFFEFPKTKCFFFQTNDISFDFRSFVSSLDYKLIDILLIDSDHRKEHVLKQIQVWFPFLSSKAKVFFHDTMYPGWKQVFEAIQTFLREPLEYKAFQRESKDGKWFLKHFEESFGLMILSKRS